ncbi:MAG: hypothetical protein JNJ69_00785 [Leptospiraceae bacterium]|nr:hypothetical protein [Leptospiraceae bacterium]
MKFRKEILLLALTVFFAGCRSSVDIVISRHIDPDDIRRVAIFKMDRLSYRDNDKVSDLLTHEFLRLGYDVVERTEIERLIKEQKLGASGLIDPNQAVAIGKLAGADSIVIGSGALEDKTRDVLKYFTIKIIDLKSGSVVVTANLTRNLEIKEAISELSTELKKALEAHQQQKKRGK